MQWQVWFGGLGGFLPSGPVLHYNCSGGVRYGTQAYPMGMSLYH